MVNTAGGMRLCVYFFSPQQTFVRRVLLGKGSALRMKASSYNMPCSNQACDQARAGLERLLLPLVKWELCWATTRWRTAESK